MLASHEVRFGNDGFERLIDAISAAGYIFARFDVAPPASKSIVRLRFDVDISPAATLNLADILRRRGAAATFLFQLNSETYCIFSRQVLDNISELRGQGHAVGLHIDSSIFCVDESHIAATLDWFSTCCREVDRVVSFHRPDSGVLGRHYASFKSAYSAEFFEAERYLSDSRRSLDFVGRLGEWLDEGRTPIQLLLHPEWWETPLDVDGIWNALRRRRMAELEDYVAANFRKVFSPVLKATGVDPP
jgi:hypothetical protein